ncbi:hypothetical protein BJF78_22715 [Pseudonocardia sp. CNS-139]|nr:hypothetical protein BJF78_22715 [Pseudonocardia sp. CNS-139]
MTRVRSIHAWEDDDGDPLSTDRFADRRERLVVGDTERELRHAVRRSRDDRVAVHLRMRTDLAR